MAFDGNRYPVIGQPSRLRDELRRGDMRGRELEESLAFTLLRWQQANRIQPPAMIRALMGQFTAAIFAGSTGPAEARAAAEEVCAELLRRITEH